MANIRTIPERADYANPCYNMGILCGKNKQPHYGFHEELQHTHIHLSLTFVCLLPIDKDFQQINALSLMRIRMYIVKGVTVDLMGN